MKIETINGIRVITPDVGMFLYKETDRIISDKVFLGVNDTQEGWTEISDAKKQELEAAWAAEADPTNLATDADYINALESLGVAFDG